MNVTPEQEKLFKKNYKAIKKNYAALAEYIDMELPKNIDLYNVDGEIDVLINGVRFYGVDARVFVGQQVEMYLENPGVIELAPPVATSERTPFHVHFYDKFHKSLVTSCTTVANQPLRPDTMNLFVFGMGLGLHLLPIAAHSRCKELIIIEPEIIFIRLSMYFMDWAKLLKLMKGRVQFIFERDPEKAFSSLRWHISQRNPGVQQKVFYYKHYRTPYVDAIDGYFKDNASLFFDGLGFYDDEKNMFKNHLQNLFMDEWVMCGPLKGRRIENAVIVGAGPSLKNDIEWLRTNQESLIIFSGGSSLQALLRNGITPDYHVEIENISLNYDILSPLFDEFDLSKLVLICSSTMDTRSAHLFSRRMWFMREGVMATSLHASDVKTMLWQNPTVVNTALSAALSLGFRNLLLLGADFGTKNPKVHHIPGTSYETLDQLKAVSFDFPEQVKGNFGGDVHTNRHMKNGISYIKTLVGFYPGVRVVNASDGAAIPSVQPVRVKRYPITKLSQNKSIVIDHLYAQSPIVNWKERLGEDVFEDMTLDINNYAEKFYQILSYRAKRDRDIVDFLSKFYKNLNTLEEYYAKYNPLLTGTLSSFSILMMYWWRRMPEEELPQYGKICRRLIKRFMRDLAKDFGNFLKSVRQELPLVRPELFDDKGNLIVEAKPSVQNAE